MDSLTNSSQGFWSVETVSGSSYLLDLDNRVVLRQAETAAEDGTLRRDGDPIRLICLQRCEVGDSMILLLDLCVPGVDFTTRISTTVIRIELISSSSDEDL